jgi:hypothetical protein
MDDRAPWRPMIRRLIYGIQFELDPLEGLDRVLESVVRSDASRAGAQEYRAAITAALASGEALSQLLPHGRADGVIRAYLGELERRLKAEGPGAD